MHSSLFLMLSLHKIIVNKPNTQNPFVPPIKTIILQSPKFLESCQELLSKYHLRPTKTNSFQMSKPYAITQFFLSDIHLVYFCVLVSIPCILQCVHIWETIIEGLILRVFDVKCTSTNEFVCNNKSLCLCMCMYPCLCLLLFLLVSMTLYFKI
jgi:hypothetical protein